jgi:hypothetical protein
MTFTTEVAKSNRDKQSTSKKWLQRGSVLHAKDDRQMKDDIEEVYVNKRVLKARKALSKLDLKEPPKALNKIKRQAA